MSGYKFRLFNLLKFIVSLLLLCIPYEFINAQAKEFSEKDLDKLKEAQVLKLKANEEQLKTNEIYQEMSLLKQDENYSSDKNIQRKYKSLESKAQNIELKAAQLFGESNKILWDLYKKYIEDFWNNFNSVKTDLVNALLIEEKGFEFLYRAASLRESANKTNNLNEAIPKLTEAYELEIIGLEKLEMAYKIYKTWPDIPDNENTTIKEEQIKDPTVTYMDVGSTSISSTRNLSEDNTAYESSMPSSDYNQDFSKISSSSIDKVELDNERIRRFQKYITEHKDDSIYILQNYISGYDMESINKFWSIYKNIELEDRPIDQLARADDSNIETELITTETTIEESSSQATEEYKEYEKTGYGKVGENELEIGIVSKDILTGDKSKIIYRVQIAKNKTPLSQGLLEKIYMGNHTIGMVNEDGWYKYSIGDFSTYEDADQFRNKLNIEEAFVVAYKDIVEFQDTTSEIALTETNNESNEILQSPRLIESTEKPVNTYSPKTYQGDNNKIVFIVQIAASRTSMSKRQLSRLYSGPYEIMLRQEEGWYKYQIGHSFSYIDAKKVLQTVKVHGAFIAAYKGDYKYKLWEAIRINREISNEIVFKLQIAASRVQMDNEDVKKIFDGRNKVDEIFEEGMYKYQIAAGNDYEAARRIKNLWGIKGSFIVPYRNGNKLSIREAIELTK